MKAASREAQAKVSEKLDQLIQNSDNAVAVAMNVGAELFLIVNQLDGERALRIAVADNSVESSQRTGIMRDVFSAKVADPTLEVLLAAAEQELSLIHI